MFNRLKKFFLQGNDSFQYDPVDKDGDGIVQEGTKFERQIVSAPKSVKKTVVKKKSVSKKSPVKKTVVKKTAKKSVKKTAKKK